MSLKDEASIVTIEDSQSQVHPSAIPPEDSLVGTSSNYSILSHTPSTSIDVALKKNVNTETDLAKLLLIPGF